jgi:hypothetical protein
VGWSQTKVGFASRNFCLAKFRHEVNFGFISPNKKASLRMLPFLFGGERGIRTPGPVTVNGFQDRRIRPLCHLSGAKIGLETKPTKKLPFIL